MKRQEKTPLFDGVLSHIKSNPVQFHIPGHVRGAGMEERFREFLGENALAMDLINIAPLDDLHHPHGIIQEAQELAAEAFGADYTFFSVQGTSGAIMTMIMSVVGPGDKIIVPRNVHKSVITAIVLSGAIPVFMDPEVDHKFGIRHGVKVDTVQRLLDEHPDAKAVLVINPTYFGVCTDLKTIVELAHERNIPVLVDEAQGVHTNFHEDLPISAMQAGADIAATSVHKLGGSLTQTSVINVRSGRVSPGRVQAIISMLTTTSTSYLLLCSLDAARKQLATKGREMVDRAIQLASQTRAKINRIPGLFCLGEEVLGTCSSRHSFDQTKLCINVKDLGLLGIEMEQLLREEFKIEVELSDLYNILCIVSFGHEENDMATLVFALETLSNRYFGVNQAREVEVKVNSQPMLAMAPRDAFYADTEELLLTEAVGRVTAESIMVYPPGIPVLLPGELITQDNIDYIIECMEAGLPVQGTEDEDIRYVKVVKRGYSK